ncbi:MAG: S1 RNA-binding domain-containing protein, partial [Pseudomonadota bacterium]
MDNFAENNSTEKIDKEDLTDQAGTEQPVDDQVSKDVQDSGDSKENYEDMYAESFKRFEEGELVAGRIIAIDKDYVIVDIGYKSEGQIRIREFMDDQGNINASQGDDVEVMVEYWDEDEERVVLSKEKAAKVKIWEDIKRTYDNGETVEGVILARVKGGFSVDIGVQAFLPGSQA